MSYLIYQILKLRAFLLGTGVAGLLLMIVFLIWAVRPKRGPMHYGLQSFFFHLTLRDTVYLSSTLLQLLFALSMVTSRATVERIHLYMIVGFCLVKFVTRPGIPSLALDAVYSVLLTVLLLVCNLFGGFLNQSEADLILVCMYGLLMLLTVEFSIWYFVRCLRVLTKERATPARTLRGLVGRFAHRRTETAAEGDV
ncbi:MAG: hypothetical protein LUE63_08890 [Lachnospiraceae bacterium]|nr:hypothetical protein [Lachnospiraceae bacterium]